MGAFLDAQIACVDELARAGYSGARVVWDWETDGWAASAPNTGRRWRCYVVGRDTVTGIYGTGDTGEEALRALVAKLKEIGDGTD